MKVFEEFKKFAKQAATSEVGLGVEYPPPKVKAWAKVKYLPAGIRAAEQGK